MRGSERDLTGRRLGDFVVRRRIGEGGQGVVWLAEQASLGREAIIKIVRREHGGAAPVGERALSEAVTASRLDHPYAAHIYAVGEEPDGLVWIAMEYVNGTPLDEVLATAPMPLERFVPFFDRLCEVANAGHELGIVHRDIKPSNVMVLTRSGRLLPKLLDFGIARLREASTDPTASAKGSPLYLPPERWLDATAGDARGDVYSLGVVAYESLTGRPPFRGATLVETARAHGTHAPPALDDKFPAGLDDVLARAMAKRPEDRFSTPLDLAAAVRAAAGLDAPTTALPQLPEDVRRAALEHAPQPIAEAVAALEAARNAHQAREALVAAAGEIARWVGILALACRSRVGPGQPKDASAVVEAANRLRRQELSRGEWLELAREICRPFARRREAFPLPELVAAFFGRGGEDRRTTGPIEVLVAHLDTAGSSAARPDAEVRSIVAAGLARLAAALQELTFLGSYPLVVPRGQFGELWVGVRRPERLATIVRGSLAPEGRPVLLDADGGPVLGLWPLVQTRPPSPGTPDEIFVAAGGGQGGARLDAPPKGYQHHDEEVWTWLGALLGGDADDAQRERADDELTPYRGLEAFAAEDATLFFGREREAEAVVNRLRDQTFVAVVGPSGAGKSSFVQAGVIPRLPPTWRVATVRPGANPMVALRTCLQRSTPSVLVVDQFEELFTLCHDSAERERFASDLVWLASRSEAAVRIVLTLRDDFLIRAEQLAPLRSRLGPGLQLLATPADEDLLRILIEPARRAGYELEDPELPREMIAQVSDQPGALAILSFTAAKLWDVRDRHFKLLRRRSYEALGGVGGALTQHAEAILAGMTPDDQRLVREAFRHLVTAEGTRAVLSRPELLQLLGGGERAERVIEKLVAARLVVASEAPGGQDRVEIVHEALLDAWPRLATWRREDAEGARLRDQLRAAARQWHERDRARGLLWRDDALAEYRLWRARHSGALTEVETAFAHASLADAARSKRLVRTTVAAVVAVLAAGLVVVIVLNTRSRAAQRSAERARAEAVRSADDSRRRLLRLLEEQGRRELLAGQPQRALALLAEAYAGGDPSPALRFMVARAADPLRRRPMTLTAGQSLFSLAVSRDGVLVATGDDSDSAKIWETASGRLRCSLDTTSKVSRLDFSSDSHRLVSGSFDGKGRIWDAKTCELLHVLEDPGQMETARFSPDGRRVVTAANDTPTLWDASTGAMVRPLRGHRAPVQMAIFSPDGRRIATGGEDKTVMVWDATDGHLLWTLRGHEARISAMAFSADGARLVTGASGLRTGDQDFIVRLWDLASGGVVTPLVGHRGHILGVEFSPDGMRVASASMDGSAAVWDVASGKRLFALAHPASVGSVAFAPDGRKLLTTGFDGSVRIWAAEDGTLVASLVGHRALVRRGLFLPGGKRVVTISFDGDAKIWPIGADYESSLAEAQGVVNSAAFSADGRRLLTARRDGLAIWDLVGRTMIVEADDESTGAVGFSPDGARIVTLGKDAVLLRDDHLRVVTRVELAETPVSAAFSPDGRRFAVADLEGVIHVHSAETGESVRMIRGDPSPVWGLAFTSSGEEIVAAGHTGKLEVWELSTGRLVREIAAHQNPIYDVDLCGSAGWIATAGGDRTAKIWGLDDGHLVTVLEGHADQVIGVGFSRDCAFVVTFGPDSARIWSPTDGKELFAYRHQGDILWWAGIGADGTQIATAGDDGGVRFWSAALEVRDASEVLREAHCLTPYRVRDERIVLETIDDSCPQ